jgi:protein arginine kinase
MLASGLGFQRMWTQLNALDDRLAMELDYAFDKQFGYLTSTLSHVGTGLKASVILHLPGLAMTNNAAGLADVARHGHHAIHGLKSTVSVPGSLVTGEELHITEAFYNDLSGTLYGDVNEAEGDLYLLTNASTLGKSEQEILFHLQHTATDIISQEKDVRETLVRKERRRIEDRVARALGIARSARLLGFAEAVSLLSSLRLGLDTGLLEDYTLQHLNELLLAAQSAHLKVKTGRECDEGMLSIERADLFRARFAVNEE